MRGTKKNELTTISYGVDTVNIDGPPQDEKRSQKALIAEAQIGFADEKELGPRAALKAYPNAVLWSLAFAACVIMEGYDTALLGSFYAYRTAMAPLWHLTANWFASCFSNQIRPFRGSYAKHAEWISVNRSLASWHGPSRWCRQLFRSRSERLYGTKMGPEACCYRVPHRLNNWYLLSLFCIQFDCFNGWRAYLRVSILWLRQSQVFNPY